MTIHSIKSTRILILCLLMSGILNLKAAGSQYAFSGLLERDNMLEESKNQDKEIALRKALKEIRDAIKEYKFACANGLIGPLDRKKDDMCYPPTLEVLGEFIKPPNKGYYIVFLKKIPVDPITGKAEWGLRSFQDEKTSETWGGQNVYDVYCKSEAYAADGTRYRDW